MTVVITGWNTTIAKAFRAGTTEECVRGDLRPSISGETRSFPLTKERYLFCQGLLRPKAADEQTAEEAAEGMDVNWVSIQNACSLILSRNLSARICIIGSESAYRGSYDGIYADAKRGIHEFVETRRLPSPKQQLVAISPGIIEDAGMTQRRADKSNLLRRRTEHPMKRFLTAQEVADMARTLLYDQPYISGTVIRMHGGLV